MVRGSLAVDLPLLPDKARLAVEESEGVLHISWPVRAGELRRKLAVGFLCLAIVGCAWVIHTSWPPAGRSLWLWIPKIVFITYWSLLALDFLIQILSQAQASGYSSLKLSERGLTFMPGGGGIVFHCKPSQILTISARGKLRLVVNLWGRWPLRALIRRPTRVVSPHGYAILTPGEEEARWLADVLRCWRLDPLRKDSLRLLP